MFDSWFRMARQNHFMKIQIVYTHETNYSYLGDDISDKSDALQSRLLNINSSIISVYYLYFHKMILSGHSELRGKQLHLIGDVGLGFHQHFLDGQLDRSFSHRSLLRTIEEFVRKLRQKATNIQCMYVLRDVGFQCLSFE